MDRPLKKPARQGGKPAKKQVYPAVNDRILLAGFVGGLGGAVADAAPPSLFSSRILCKVSLNHRDKFVKSLYAIDFPRNVR